MQRRENPLSFLEFLDEDPGTDSIKKNEEYIKRSKMVLMHNLSTSSSSIKMKTSPSSPKQKRRRAIHSFRLIPSRKGEVEKKTEKEQINKSTSPPKEPRERSLTLQEFLSEPPPPDILKEGKKTIHKAQKILLESEIRKKLKKEKPEKEPLPTAPRGINNLKSTKKLMRYSNLMKIDVERGDVDSCEEIEASSMDGDTISATEESFQKRLSVLLDNVQGVVKIRLIQLVGGQAKERKKARKESCPREKLLFIYY